MMGFGGPEAQQTFVQRCRHMVHVDGFRERNVAE
jgi:hypothetical protein